MNQVKRRGRGLHEKQKHGRKYGTLSLAFGIYINSLHTVLKD